MTESKTEAADAEEAVSSDEQGVPIVMQDGYDPGVQAKNAKDKKLNEAIAATAGSDNIPPHVTENERINARIAAAEHRHAKDDKK